MESKGHLDLVTEADRAVETLLLECLASAFPEDGIFGEEAGRRPSRSGRTWVIDPIDGTFNFVPGSDQWSVSIGLHDGEGPVFGALYLPAQEKLVVGGRQHWPTLNGKPLAPLSAVHPDRAVASVGFHNSTSGMRRAEIIRHIVDEAAMAFRHCGCGTVSILDVALGRVDGYVGLGEASWDIMAALAILEPLGGTSTVDWAKTAPSDKFILACGSQEFIQAMSPIVAFGEKF